jgi:hypothetical protein
MRLPTHRCADDAAISAEVIDYLPPLAHSIVGSVSRAASEEGAAAASVSSTLPAANGIR